MFIYSSHPQPLPFRRMSPWSQGINQPISPQYTPCISVSRIRSALPHRVNAQQSDSVDYVVHSRSPAFHSENQTLRRERSIYLISNPRSPRPKSDSRTLTPPGRCICTCRSHLSGSPIISPADCIARCGVLIKYANNHVLDEIWGS